MSLFSFGFTSSSSKGQPPTSIAASSDHGPSTIAEVESGSGEESVDSDSAEEELDEEDNSCAKRPKRTSAGKSTSGKDQCKSRKRKFRPGWTTDKRFAFWLRFDADKGLMTCKLCVESCFRNNFTLGCGDMRRSALCRHELTADHRAAVSNHAQRQALQEATQHAVSSESAILAAMKATYWLAKEEIASSKFGSLCDLLVSLNADGVRHLSLEDPTRKGEQLTYRSNRSVADFQKAISDVIEQDVLQKIHSSPAIGVLADETSDITVTHKMVIYIRAVDPDNQQVREFFLADVEIDSADAETITSKAIEVLDGKDVERRRVTGLGTDGAAVMTGKHNGFGVRMKRGGSPFVIQVHCVAHRLALASGQAADTVPLVEKYQQTVNSLYNFFDKSTKRMSALRQMQAVYHDHEIALQATFSTRWLSFRGAVDAIRKSLPSLLQCLSQMSAEGDATATGHYRAVKKPSFVLLTYLLSDVLNVLTKLSCLFQSSTLNLAAIQPMVKSTVATIASMKDAPGPHLAGVLEQLAATGEGHDGAEIVLVAEQGQEVSIEVSQHAQDTFHSARQQYLQAVVDNMAARFPVSDLDVVQMLQIFDPRNLPKDKSDIATYGNNQIRQLARHFSEAPDDGPGIVNADLAVGEWALLRSLMVTSYSHLDLEQFSQQFLKLHKGTFPGISPLIFIALVLPVTNAGSERGFSTQNRITTKLRNRLLEGSIDRLMRIAMEGPHIDAFNFGEALNVWRNAKARRLFGQSPSAK